jgi:hypothetical protein
MNEAHRIISIHFESIHWLLPLTCAVGNVDSIKPLAASSRPGSNYRQMVRCEKEEKRINIKIKQTKEKKEK